MRPSKNYDPATVIAGIIAGSIFLGVMIAPIVPRSLLGWVGALLIIPVLGVVGFAAWGVLTTLFRGLR